MARFNVGHDEIFTINWWKSSFGFGGLFFLWFKLCWQCQLYVFITIFQKKLNLLKSFFIFSKFWTIESRRYKHIYPLQFQLLLENTYSQVDVLSKFKKKIVTKSTCRHENRKCIEFVMWFVCIKFFAFYMHSVEIFYKCDLIKLIHEICTYPVCKFLVNSNLIRYIHKYIINI